MKKELFWTDTGRNEMTVLLDEYDRRNWKGGFEEGYRRSENKWRDTFNHELSMLTACMVADSRFDDLAKINMDPDYRSELLNFYFPEGVPGNEDFSGNAIRGI